MPEDINEIMIKIEKNLSNIKINVEVKDTGK
jgi:hypothetical protein